jgi:hypothetical protein
MHNVESASDPAMNTILFGALFVVLIYLAQSALVAMLWGPIVAAIYLASLPLAADINFYLSDRMRRARWRARAFLTFRRNPGLQRRLTDELARLRTDVIEFERDLNGAVV